MWKTFILVQFSSVAQSCPWTATHQASHCHLPEFTQTHVRWVGNAIQPSHPLSSPSPPAFNLSHHQSLFQWVSSAHQVAKVLEFQLQHQSFQWIPRTDFLSDGLVYLPKFGYFQKVTFSGKTGNQTNPDSEKNMEATHKALKKSPVIHVYVRLSPFAVHLKLSQHCLLTGYTPIQNQLK